MKILIAGSTGAIGQAFIPLAQKQHEIYGITQSKGKASALVEKGVNPIILDVLDRDAVFAAVEKIQPDIIVDMLTHLPKEYTPKAMKEAALMDAKVRVEGGGNLHSAAEAHSVKKYIMQSVAFFYSPGNGFADESTAFAFEASPGIAAACQSCVPREQRVLQSAKVPGTVLRFGFFYGPGTWFNPDGNMADQVRNQQVPVIGDGKGIWSFVHIEDAASAIVAAIEAKAGVYNIVNDDPSEMQKWLPAFARYIGTKQPPHITQEEGIKEKGEDFVYYATRLRGASNSKAKRELHFRPRAFEWLTK